MKDFIFVTGASGIGKSTLCNGLLDHYRTTVVEQHMVPEFITRDGKEEVIGELEELTCWEVQVAMMLKFHELLIINSSLDAQVYEADIEGWKELEGNDNISIVMLDDVSHTGYVGDISSEKEIYKEQKMSDELILLVAQFIKQFLQ